MDINTLLTIGAFVILLVLLAFGVPFYIAFVAAAVPVLFVLVGAGPISLGDLAMGTVRGFSLIAIPIFLFVGYMLSECGAAKVLFDVVRAFVGHTRSGLGISAVVACCMFGTMCGSSVATAIAVGTIVVPHLVRNGYKREYAAAICGCSGSLGTVMPPSVNLVILGEVLQVNIGDLFIACIVPALLTTALLSAAVYFTARGKKEIILEHPFSWKEKRRAIVNVLPVAAMPIAIIGSLYGGICTPTEAAGVSCLVGLLLARFYFRKFGWEELKRTLKKTAVSSAAVYTIIFGAVIFGKAVSIIGLPQGLALGIGAMGLGILGFKALFFGLFTLFGMFFSGMVMMLVALPPLLTTVGQFGIPIIPFGVMFELVVELGQTTPPLAITLYAAASGAGASSGGVVRYAPPFIAAWAIATLIVLYFPVLGSFY